ncbi:hypothetical protein OG496_54125 [Streptomyces sp. NBC_00988]|uniref:hypothetical protein n=1 Tax=Streptomyces sp. NBC_00988 TaxID=2903704 RepID=UPI00386CE25C|nr:hypothetical protein OG496_54125 [Streptomyces sp. NBC_00988]
MTTSTRQARRTATATRPKTTARPRTTPRRVLPWWLLAAVALAVAAAITGLSLLTDGGARRQATAPTPSPSPTAVIATIDGQTIPVREFALYLAQERSATFTHFQNTFGAQDGPHFWTTSYGGSTPTDYIKKQALADVTRTTVQQQLAHHYGLLADPSYATFLLNWTKENQRRQQAVAAHQVIYGPVQYTEANYFDYVLSNLTFDLEKKLADAHVITTDDKALRAYYTAHKSDFRRAKKSGAVSLTSPNGSTPITTPPFAQVRKQVKQAYLDDRYKAKVTQLVRSARVAVAHGTFQAVTVN